MRRHAPVRCAQVMAVARPSDIAPRENPRGLIPRSHVSVTWLR